MFLYEIGLSKTTGEDSEEKEETENDGIYSRIYCLCLCVSASGQLSVCAAVSFPSWSDSVLSSAANLTIYFSHFRHT